MTVADVCTEAGVSRDTVYDWIHSGDLRARVKKKNVKRVTYVIDRPDFDECKAKRVVVVAKVPAPVRRVRVEHVYV